jgi:outer membrane protein assembly factor BamB
MKLAIFVSILVISHFSFVEAADWNQWRGPNRDGSVSTFNVPEKLPEQLTQVWNVVVGIGHASPVISGNQVFLISRVEEQEVIAAYDRATGKLIWKDSYDAPYQMNPAAIPHGKGPKSTPVVANGKLYTFGITGVLSCYDVAAGKLLWRNDFKKEFPVVAPDFGTAMSPLVDRGLLIVHAGGPGKGALFALDAEKGNVKWRWSGDSAAYASPIVVDLNGTRQIITQTQKHIVAIDETKGELLWQIPFTTDYEQNIVTPVLYKDLLIFSGLDKGAFAVRISKQEGKWVPQEVWKNEKASMYMSSPVLVGDFLYGMSHYRKGQFFCIDARTGQTLWTSNGAEGDNAAVINAGTKLLFLSNNADLTIANATEKKYEVLKKYNVAKSPTWAHPAVADNQIVVKDLKSLTLYALK